MDIDGRARMVVLTYGTMNHGGTYWCYVAVRPSLHKQFGDVIASGGYNIQNFVDDGYGEIIVSGEGVLPPPDITKEVARIFNVPIKELLQQIDVNDFIAQHMPGNENGENAAI